MKITRHPGRFIMWLSFCALLAACSSGSSAPQKQVDIDATGQPVSSNYVTSRSVINPYLGATVPAKGMSRKDPVTGVKITRLTDASELDETSDALIVYSRYSPENSSGDYFLVFGSNSTSSWVIERATGKVLHKLQHAANKGIGEYHEVRWDLTGNHPHRVYYRYDAALYMIDDVTAQTLQTSLVKDFSGVIPADSTLVYNDVEGDSSNDSDHWAFMAAHYNGKTNVVDAFVHYQISTDSTHLLTPADLAATNLAHYADASAFPRPNMVEISPLGTGIVLHYGRAWGDNSYGERPADIGSWFDGPHLWPLDFNVADKTPVKISVGETHSGWAFAADGRELFISQNNRTDYLDAVYVSGENAGYDNRIAFGSHKDFGWSNGFHFGKMPPAKSGWAFVNTYANTASKDWGDNQLVLMQIKPEAQKPVIWRVGPNYNKYAGDYRDEAPAAMNMLGNRIYVSNNWGGKLDHREVFLFELPDDWASHF